MTIDNLDSQDIYQKTTARMPVLFIGHGNPMNAIEDTEYSGKWRKLGDNLPRPKAILCISAHWETRGSLVTAMDDPPTIHDFGGFPKELFDVEYTAPGSLWLAELTQDNISGTDIGYDYKWGLDHGCWSVLRRMYPDADIPVVQLSLDRTKTTKEHYQIGMELLSLRDQGVLIIGSGNLVHNLRKQVLTGNPEIDFKQPFGLDWALEANALFKMFIDEDRHQELMDYKKLGESVQLAVPTPEHYLPMLYIIALKQTGESVTYFNDEPVAGSLTMTSFLIK